MADRDAAGGGDGWAVAEPLVASRQPALVGEPVQPIVPLAPVGAVVIRQAPGSEAANQIRLTRLAVEERPELRVLTVTSPRDGDGKTTVAVNLALALAEGGRKRVALLELDGSRPSVSQVLGFAPPAVTVSELADGSARGVLAPVRVAESCWALPARSRIDNPVPFLYSPALLRLMVELRWGFDAVVIDAPPLARAAATNVVDELCDGVLLVVRARRVTAASLEAASRRLRQAKLVGVVLNRVAAADRESV